METVDLKLVLLGQPGVGKTCLVYRYLYDTFGETISTIGASFAMKKVENGGTCNLGIWDTAGQERFDSLSSFYCRGARAAIICFDLTDRQTFDCLQNKWIKKVVDEAEQGCHICIVGTKVDLVQSQPALRAVRKEEVDALAAKHQAHVFEASAKAGSGVSDIFDCIVERFHSRVQAAEGDSRQRGVAVGARHKQGCC